MVDWSRVQARAVQVSDGLSATLERMIRDGTILEHERLPPERELAQHLGVSRTSVREALHELELKGLVDRRPGRGTVVVPRESSIAGSLLGHLDTQERSFREVMDLRAALEPPIAARAAKRRTGRDLERLHDLVDRMAAERSVARSARLDVEFHEAIAEATHNPLLVRLLGFASEWIDETRRERILSKRRRAQSIRAHREVLDAIVARDSGGAYDAMSRHIVAVNELLEERDPEVAGG